jgi:hypothetical protein
VAWSEHAAEGRQHHVEVLVLKWNGLGVTLDPLDADTGLCGQSPAGFEELGCEIESNNVPTGLRGPDRRVTGAAGHVEHPFVFANTDPLDDPLAHFPQSAPGDFRKIARRPRRTCELFQLGQSGRLGRGHVEDCK